MKDDPSATLPGYLFNQRAAGTISVVVLFNQTDGRLTSDMNAVFTADSLDPADDTVFAVSEATKVTVTLTASTTLSTVAAGYHTTFGDLGAGAAAVPLAPPAPVRATGIEHEVAPGETLASRAA